MYLENRQCPKIVLEAIDSSGLTPLYLQSVLSGKWGINPGI